MQLVNEIFVGSLTGKTEKEQLFILEKARDLHKNDKLKVAVSPNIISKNFLKMLKNYNVNIIELEVHSANTYILKKCDFTYTLEDIKKASKLVKRKMFKLAFQVGIGLPDSNKFDELNTAKELAKLKPNLVRIYPMVVVRNTKLEVEFNEGRYEPLTLNQAIERCKETIYEFNRKKVKQINIVKQNELNKSEDTEIIARSFSSRICSISNRQYLV